MLLLESVLPTWDILESMDLRQFISKAVEKFHLMKLYPFQIVQITVDQISCFVNPAGCGIEIVIFQGIPEV